MQREQKQAGPASLHEVKQQDLGVGVDAPLPGPLRPQIKRKFCEIGRFKKLMLNKGKLAKRAVRPRAPSSATVSLRQFMPTPMNQEGEGSCTAFSLCHYIKALDPTQDPSPQYLYTKELLKENPGQPLQDVGADAADGASIAYMEGVCPNDDFPYPVNPQTGQVLNFGQLPSQKAIADAAAHKLPYLATNVTYNGPLLPTVTTLIDENTPVAIGAVVYPSFLQTDGSGVVPMPSANERAGDPLGGHEFLAIGYKPGFIECENSWGTEWGDKGFFYLPNDYLSVAGKDGPLVQQLLAIAPIPAALGPTPTPPPPAPPLSDVAQIRLQLSALVSNLMNLQTELADGYIPPNPVNTPTIEAQLGIVAQELSVMDGLLAGLPQ